MGEYLKNMTTKSFQPYFVVKEHLSYEPLLMKYIDLDVIQKMTMSASFDLGTLLIQVSNEYAKTNIALCMAPKEEYSISGFPRILCSSEVLTSTLRKFALH